MSGMPDASLAEESIDSYEDSVRHKQTAAFHEQGTLAALWLLVIFVSIQILKHSQHILEPVLWAFFMMMGLVPLADLVEKGLMRLGYFCQSCSNRSSSRSTPVLDIESSRPPPGPWTSQSADEAEWSDDVRRERPGHRWARFFAVVIVLVFMAGCAFFFFTVVYRSVYRMQHDLDHYRRGAQNIEARIRRWTTHFPDGTVEALAEKATKKVESCLLGVVASLLEATSNTAVELIWIGLYMMFWLCQPFHVGREVSTVFRRYIFLKMIASASYAFCIGLLLHFLGVSLAIVFGLIAFILNFIPEIGPFIAMSLPLPVILFDDRIAHPIYMTFLALFGQLGLKVVFGNFVEIKLIESQQEMRMHPVIILFFVAFFQFVWGATGMLLSVPIVAALKATLHRIPPNYRDRVLIFLEGDAAAPQKWRDWREDMRKQEEHAAAL